MKTFGKHTTYSDSGVDITEAQCAVDMIKDAVKDTARDEVIGGIGGFGSLFSAKSLKDMRDPVLVSGTDGVGTKLAIAQRFRRHGNVGEDLVAMCVDDIVVVGAEPLFFLDYIAVGKLEAQTIKTIVEGIARGCKLSGCALVGGEMAEHPGVMPPDDYDLAGFVVGAVDGPCMLGPERVCIGDVILGIPSSGIHSNGYSLVRKVVIEPKTDEELLEPQDFLGGKSLVDALLEPTKIYAKQLLGALKDGACIHAMAHITGGGITNNLDRALPFDANALVYRDLGWEIPPIISYVCREASLTSDEAYSTFNMGVGMCVICPRDAVVSVQDTLKRHGLMSFVMGEVQPGAGKVVYRD